MLSSPFSSRGIRKFKEVARGCTSQKGQSGDADPGLLDSKSCVLPTASGGGTGRAPSAISQPSPPLPLLPTLHTHLEGQLVSLGWTWALMAPLAPTAPPHVPSLHTKARLPSPHVLRSQGGVLRLQHSKLVGSKALSTTGKALMTLPTAKVLISFPSNPELKLASSILKPRKVGLEL